MKSGLDAMPLFLLDDLLRTQLLNTQFTQMTLMSFKCFKCISFFRIRQSLLLPKAVPDIEKVGKFDDDK